MMSERLHSPPSPQNAPRGCLVSRGAAQGRSPKVSAEGILRTLADGATDGHFDDRPVPVRWREGGIEHLVAHRALDRHRIWCLDELREVRS